MLDAKHKETINKGAARAGTQEKESASKKGFKVPRIPMANTDLARLINSDEVQSVVNAPKAPKFGSTLKKNPLRNLGAMLKLNPYAKTLRRREMAQAVRPSCCYLPPTCAERLLPPVRCVRNVRDGRAPPLAWSALWHTTCIVAHNLPMHAVALRSVMQ